MGGTAYRFRLGALHDIDVELFPECLGTPTKNVVTPGKMVPDSRITTGAHCVNIVAVNRRVGWEIDTLLPSAADRGCPPS